MGYKDRNKQRAYCRDWMRRRRKEWLQANGPCRCGSWDRLEVHHRDPAQKVTHRIWSYCDEKRAAELAKCEVLCYRCHLEATRAHRRSRRALSAETVAAIWRLLRQRIVGAEVARRLGIGQRTVSAIKCGAAYRDLMPQPAQVVQMPLPLERAA